MALIYTPMGFEPAVYLLMKRGRTICSGVIGMARRASRSLGTPASTNFNPVIESAAANPIYKVMLVLKFQ